MWTSFVARAVRVLHYFVIALVFSSTVVAPSNAALEKWSRVPAYGGKITAVKRNPSTVDVAYAGTAWGRLFKSTDGGNTWVAAGSPITTHAITTIAVDSTDSNTIYVGTAGSGIAKSTDAGATWTLQNSGLTNLNVNAVRIHPTNHQLLFAATFGDIFRSNDGGDTWQGVGNNHGLRNNQIWDLAIDPTNPARIYAATNGGGIFATETTGTQWFDCNGFGGAVADQIRALKIRALAVDPTGNFLVAASQDAGIFLAGNIVASGCHLFDTTMDWQAASNAGLADKVVNALIANADLSAMFAVTPTGLFSSADKGNSWSSVGAGTDVLDVALSQNQPAPLLVATRTGIAAAQNGATAFAPANEGLVGLSVTTILLDPTNSERQVAGTRGSGILISSDSGATWKFSNEGLTDLDVLTIAATKTSMFAGTEQHGLFRSSDGGQTWELLDAVSPDRRVPLLYADDELLYAGTGSGIRVSEDDGATWTSLTNGITGSSRSVEAFAIDPAKPETLYTSTSASGVFKSIDSGATWEHRSSGIGSATVQSIAVDPKDSNKVFAATDGAGIFRTSDGGGKWESVDTGLADLHIVQIIFDQKTTTTLYAISETDGVYKSTDGGTSWFTINDQLPDVPIQTIALDESTKPPTLLAGTAGDGLLEIQSSKALSIPPAAPGAPAGSDNGDGGGGAGGIGLLIGLLAFAYGRRRQQIWHRVRAR